MGTFAINITKYAAARKADMGFVVREIVLQTAALVDERSPVGNRQLWKTEFIDAANKLGWITNSGKGYVGGHFRANNQYRFGAPGEAEIEGIDPSGATTLATIQAGVLSSPVAGLHYISNAVPYAMALENGHSTQAPQGIYKLAAMDMTNAARGIIAGKFG